MALQEMFEKFVVAKQSLQEKKMQKQLEKEVQQQAEIERKRKAEEALDKEKEAQLNSDPSSSAPAGAQAKGEDGDGFTPVRNPKKVAGKKNGPYDPA